MRRTLAAALLLLVTGCGTPAPAPTAAPATSVATSPTAADPIADAPACARGLPLVVLSPPGQKPSIALPIGESGTTGVVLLHQSDGNVCQLADYARHLASLGYRALTVELPRNPMDAYATAGIAWLRQHGTTKVFVLGASMGGTIAIAAAARTTPPVTGVISLSAPKEWWDIDATAEAAKLRMPVFIAAGERDRSFDDDARLIYAACGSAKKTLTVVPATSAHGIGLLDVLGPKIEAFLRG